MTDLKTRVVLETVDKTKKGVDSGISNLNRLSSTATSLGRTLFAIAGAGGIGATAFTGVVLNAAKANDEMLKAAQSVGTTTERLSELRYAGELAGVAADGIDSAVARAAKSAEDFRNRSKTAVDSFAKIGLDPTQFKDSADLFEGIVVKLSEMEDGTRKTAIAQELLGKSGKKLIPLINGGAEGLAEAAKEARELGLVFETKTAKESERLLDNISRLQKAGQGLAYHFGNQLVDELEDVTKVMVRTTKQAGLLTGVLAGIGKAIDIGFFGTDFEQRAEKIQELSRFIAKQSEVINTVGDSSNQEVISNLREKIKAAKAEMKELILIQSKALDRVDPNGVKGDKDKAPGVNPIEINNQPDSKNELEKVREEISLLSEVNSIVAQGVALEDARTIAKLRQKGVGDEIIVQLLNEQNLARTMAEDAKSIEDERQEKIKQHADWIKNSEEKEIERRKFLADLESDGIKLQNDMNQSLQEEIEQLQFEYSIRTLSSEEQRKQLALRAASLDFEKAIYELNQAGVYLTEEQTEALRKQFELAAKLKGKTEETNNVSKDFGFTFKSALEDAVVEGKNLRDVMKGLEQDILRILTRRTVTEPLSKGIDVILKKLPNIFTNFPNFNANGNAFDKNGIVPFANGGVVNQITPFTFANGGKFGVMGEAGPEAILPLTRGPNGKLGVQSMSSDKGDSNVNVYIYGAPSRPEVKQRDDGQGNLSIELFFDAVKADLSKDIGSEGPFAQKLQAQYGLNRAAGGR